MTRTLIRTLGAAVLSTLTIAGCSAGNSSPSAASATVSPTAASPAVSTSPATSSSAGPIATDDHGSQSLTAGMVLPIQAYLLPTSALIDYNNAQRVLAARCLRDYGFSQYPYPAHGRDPEPVDYMYGTNMPRRYGIADFGIAARYGYRLPPDWTAAVPADPPTLSQTETEVLTGSDTADGPSLAGKPVGALKIQDGGCLGAASRELGGVLDNHVAEGVDDQSLPASQQDPAVQAAIKAWSGCMAQSGYTYATPYDPTDKLGPTFSGPGEVRMAMADIACKRRTHLVDIWFGVESVLQKQAIASQQQELTTEARNNATLLKAAASVLSG